MFVTPQSMNDVLRRLQRRGLVERDEEAATGRARPSRLTTSGTAALERARDLLAPVESQLDAAVDDRARALRDLTALSRAF